MRCYFHLSNDRELLADPYGIGVTDLAMARAEAHRAIEELLQEDPTLGPDLSGWSLLVADSTGRRLLSLPLDGLARSDSLNELASCLN